MNLKKVNIKELSYFVVLYCLQNEISISHLKLQKLLYYIQAWHLVYFDNEDIFDEEPEAWAKGPVYRTIYNELKEFYNNRELEDYYKSYEEEEFNKVKEKISLTDEQEEFLEAILNHYGTMDHDKLVCLTHCEYPWSNARKELSPFEFSNEKVSKDDMRNYYGKLLNKKRKK